MDIMSGYEWLRSSNKDILEIYWLHETIISSQSHEQVITHERLDVQILSYPL